MGNSSSTASSSTTTNGEQYDVFLSFRGEDTRDGFTSHLYHALDEKQIKTFRDDKLVRGEEISEGLLSAIGESRISVIVFSEKYASSKWCLLELAEIMKYREMKKQIVIPVFYKVEPFDVRKSYEDASAMHKNEWRHFQEEKKIEWGPALVSQAYHLKGIVVPKGRNEAEFVCDIVRDVWNKLNNISPSCDFEDLVKDLVGIDKRIGRVVSLLCLGVPDFRIIGIWGMGGMGKTTVADAVFHLVSHQFEKTYFAPCVRAESEKDSSGLILLRDDIISKVLNEENLKIGSPSIPQKIKRRLSQKKVLIVLDDVDKLTNFEILAGGIDRFSPGSRIILTTRDQQVLRNCGVEDDNIYKVVELNRDEAFQLFRNYAFRQNHPTEDLEVLSREVVKIAKDVPLVVKVLGSSLYKKSKRDWENAVHKFQRNVNREVFGVLKISYNGLDEEEKDLFLDIACFVEFRFHINVEDFEPNLLSDRELSLSALIDKSLVTVENGRIRMHDLLREMGMEIASKNRSRLWRHEDVLRTLKHNDGSDAVQGIFLWVSTFQGVQRLQDVQLGSQVYNLRTLIIKYRPLFYMYYSKEHLRISDLDYLPDKLRYLHWEGYPLEVLPSSFNPENLVELDLSHSKIKKLWEGKTRVSNLRRLDLFSCENLISIPDLSDIPSAEIINLYGCISLLEIHSSRECPKLKRLYLHRCKNLIRIPVLADIPSAESIELYGCISLLEIHSSRECPKLKRLNLNDCQNFIRIPDLSDIPSAESINLENCSSLIEIHSSRECPKNLHSLNLSFCSNLSRFPSNIHLSEESSFSTSDVLHSSREHSKRSLCCCFCLTKFPDISGNIKSLDLSWSGVEEVPSMIGSLSKLESLDMSYCRSLKFISNSICKWKSLNRLYLYGCCKLESFPDILEGMELKYLNLSGTAIKELPPSIGNLNRLEELVLSDCKKLERLPKSIKKLSKLYYLRISYCGMILSLTELPSSLRYLEAMNCKQLILSLPDESEIELCADGGGSFIFNFLNCLRLNQKVVSNLLIFFRDSLQKMQCMGIEKIISLFERYKQMHRSICLPGSEIPIWFCCSKNIGSSTNNIPVHRNDCARSRYIMGFEVCLVIGIDRYNDDLKYAGFSCIDVYYDFHIETSDGHKEGFFRNSIQLSGMPVWGSDHILLGYNLSHKCYEFFQELDTRLANRGMSDYVGTSFVFDIQPSRFKVKYCGIQPVYVQA